MTDEFDDTLSLSTYSSIERVKQIKRVEGFYNWFKKSNNSYQKRDLINLWIRTEKELRVMFDKELKERCKNCKSCCCGGCNKDNERGIDPNYGYFSTFDLFMYKIRGLEYPKLEGFLGKKGCMLPIDKRSFICIFYTCGQYPLLILLRLSWEHLIRKLNQNKSIYDKLSNISLILSAIKDKYNPDSITFKIDEKELLKKHLNNFIKLKDISNCLTEDLNNSVNFVIKSVEASIKK